MLTLRTRKRAVGTAGHWPPLPSAKPAARSPAPYVGIYQPFVATKSSFHQLRESVTRQYSKDTLRRSACTVWILATLIICAIALDEATILIGFIVAVTGLVNPVAAIVVATGCSAAVVSLSESPAGTVTA